MALKHGKSRSKELRAVGDIFSSAAWVLQHEASWLAGLIPEGGSLMDRDLGTYAATLRKLREHLNRLQEHLGHLSALLEQHRNAQTTPKPPSSSGTTPLTSVEPHLSSALNSLLPKADATTPSSGLPSPSRTSASRVKNLGN